MSRLRLARLRLISIMACEWANAVTSWGNIGAHPDARTVSRQTAEDVFEFTKAICEYIYIGRDRFSRSGQVVDVTPSTGSPSVQ